MLNPIRILRSMFIDGGVEIVTPDIARTLIQPDADIIHYLDEKVIKVADPEVMLKPHFDKIKELFDSLKRAKIVLDWAFLGAAVGIWIWTSAQWFHAGSLTIASIYQIILGLFLLFVKPGILWVLKRFLGSRISRLQIQTNFHIG